jgi:hypothetical protein
MQDTETKEEVKTATPLRVTASKDIDFPSLGWAIKAGEERDLPVEKEAQEVILSHIYIKPITK